MELNRKIHSEDPSYFEPTRKVASLFASLFLAVSNVCLMALTFLCLRPVALQVVVCCISLGREDSAEAGKSLPKKSERDEMFGEREKKWYDNAFQPLKFVDVQEKVLKNGYIIVPSAKNQPHSDALIVTKWYL